MHASIMYKDCREYVNKKTNQKSAFLGILEILARAFLGKTACSIRKKTEHLWRLNGYAKCFRLK